MRSQGSSFQKMNTHSEQNGRHIPVQAVATSTLTDPRNRNLPSTEEITVCRDYVWGICNKHGQCKFRHECSLDEMRSIIRFCHDHQNRTGCLRPDCTYLHTSSEEENLFLTTGKLPRVLLERHTAMNAVATAQASAVATGYDCATTLFMSQPPPPPPPLSVAAPPPPPPPQPVPSVMPPPPPPPPPPTESSTIRLVPSLYTAPPPQPPPTYAISQPPPTYAISQPPPPFLPHFDASRPPPLYPAVKNSLVKRPSSDQCNAGPSKMRKTEEDKLADKMCELCIQRELSSDLCMEELEKCNRQQEYKKLLYKTKLQELENLKTMLRFLLPADICIAIEENIDGVQNPPLSLSVPMELMMHRLFEDRLSTNVLDSIQSSSMRELLLNCLLNTNTSSERSPTVETRTNDLISSDILRLGASNESYRRFVNGQSATRSTSSIRPAYPSTSSGVPRAYPSTSATASGSAATPPYPPPFQPAVPPPPVRLAYPPAYAPPPPVPCPVPPRPYSGAARGGAAPQPAPAAAPAPPMPPLPPNPHNYSQYMMGYHPPHYYPPFQ